MQEVFHLALEQPPEAREQWLIETCADDLDLLSEVSSLLKSDSAARQGFIDDKMRNAFSDLIDDGESENDAPPKSPMEGRLIDSWRVIREIGRGGMGAVYQAARVDQQYESTVAIKLVRPSLDLDFMVDRFRRERRILARLDHPNITRLLDAGTTDEGIPYLVMDYIEGVWITRYAAEHKLDTADRIRLFLPVCAAVEHAHRLFIVHRDLKPANILIDRNGTPKLLDFGISKLLQSDSEETVNTQGLRLLTPEYASPEQILGEPVTIASDVYSLGVIAYELLTGVRPHNIPHEESVLAPSKTVTDRAVARRLQGDLDNILLRALQKVPARRYLSVEHFSDDLRRYLEHRPVSARPDSIAYRASRFIRRNPLAMALGVLATTAILVGSAVSWREARIAEARFQDVRKLATTFVFDVELKARDLPGSTPVRKLIAQTGLEYLNKLASSSAGDWALKRELAGAYLRIGRVQGSTTFSNLGDFSGAMASFASAGRLLDEVIRHSPNDRQAIGDRMSVYYEVSSLQLVSAHPSEIGTAARDGLRLAESLLKVNPSDLDAAEFASQFSADLARLDEQRGNWQTALSEAQSSLSFARRSADAKPVDRDAQQRLATSYESVGSVQVLLGRQADALASFRSDIAVLEALAGKFPNDTIVRHGLMHAYARIAGASADDKQAAFLAGQKMVEQAKYLYDADHEDVRAMGDYGIALMQLGLVTPQIPVQQRTFELSHDVLSRALVRNPQSRDVVRFKTQVESELGALSVTKGDHVAATRYYQMAIATAEQALGPNPSDFSTLRGLVIGVRGLSEEQARWGSRSDTLATLDRALRLVRNIDGSAPLTALSLRANVARSWQAAGAAHLILSRREQGDLAGQDRQSAREWYQRALIQWHALENLPGFTPGLRREMETAQQALAELGPPKPRE